MSSTGKELSLQLGNLTAEDYPCDINNLGLKNLALSQLPMQANLREALDTMKDNNCEALLITAHTLGYIPDTQGILSREHIEAYRRTEF